MPPALEDHRIVRRRFIAFAKIGIELHLLACVFTVEISVTFPVEATRLGKTSCRYAASRQTELEHQYPTHVVWAWLGNSPTVARKSYLLVTESDFEKATQTDTKDTERRETRRTLQQQATSTQDSEEAPVNSWVKSSISCVFIDPISGGQGIRTLNRLPGA